MTKALLQYKNVRVFCFQAEEEVITNLDNYMDTIHFSPEINRRMLDHILAGEYELTLDNYEEEIDKVKAFSDKVQNELIGYYEDNGLLNYKAEWE